VPIDSRPHLRTNTDSPRISTEFWRIEIGKNQKFPKVVCYRVLTLLRHFSVTSSSVVRYFFVTVLRTTDKIK